MIEATELILNKDEFYDIKVIDNEGNLVLEYWGTIYNALKSVEEVYIKPKVVETL